MISKKKLGQQEVDAYNEAAFRAYNTSALSPCPNCGRTFLPDRLEVHLHSCKGNGSAMVESKKGPAMRPRGITCYVCGREYGTASIEIHLKSCKKRWEEEESQKPVKERRPLPRPPKDYDIIKAKGSSVAQKDMDAFNDEAFKQFNDESRVPCPFCGRKFLPDRLEVHLRSCGKGKEMPPKGAPPMSPQPKSKPMLGSGSKTEAAEGKLTKSSSPPPEKTFSKPKALSTDLCS